MYINGIKKILFSSPPPPPFIYSLIVKYAHD